MKEYIFLINESIGYIYHDTWYMQVIYSSNT